MLNRCLLILVLVGLFAGIALAQSDPHVVFGVLRNSDGTHPNPNCITFRAWVTTRPAQVLTQNSPGCAFEDSLWFVNVGNFPTPMLDGEELTVSFRDTCEAETLTISGTVSLTYPEENWGSFELISEGIITPTITVTAPNGGDSYVWDDPITITWTSTDLTGNVKIEYSTNGGSTWSVLAMSTANDGIHPWTAPHITSTVVMFKVSSIVTPTIFDISDGFTSIGPPPSINLIYPNGGELLYIGNVATIRWDVTGHAGPFELHISRNGGGSWTLISGGLGGRGTLDWTITGPASANCLIRVRAEGDATFSDISDAVFQIAEPVPPVGPTMVYPNGGETFIIGTEQAIAWNAGDVVGDLELHISRDNGSSWTPVAGGLGAGGLYNWTVTGPASGNCLMRIRSVGTPTLFDVSDARFTISEPPPPADTIPPAQILNLTVVEVQANRARLSWSAPGDDGNTGTAASYTMGYDLFAFTWPATWSVAGMPAPALAGTAQSVWIEGLTPGTEYWAAMKAFDEVPNASPMSNMVNFTTPIIPDTIAPAAFVIDTMAVRVVGFDNFTIFWNAPGDDGNIGTASAYDFRISGTAFTAGTFDAATPILAGVPAPLPAGTLQTLTVNGLTPNTEYWIAGRASDEVPNVGPVSNVLRVRTHIWTDLIPVGDIRDLTCGDLDRNAIELVFTAPGDDGMTGTVGLGFEVRVQADTPFDPIMWPFADVYDTIPPVPARTEVHYYVTGLDPGRQYFFVVRGIDNDGPPSNPSALAGCWTLGRMNPMPDIVMNEDDPDSFFPNIPAIFNPPSGLIYGVSSSSAGVIVSLVGTTMRVSLAENYFGESWIVITAGDGEDVLVDSVRITVNPVNDAPIFVTTPAETLILDGFPWEYMAIAIDIESEPVSYGLISGPVGMEVDISGYANWLPTDLEGTYTIRIGAWDDADTTIQEINLVVIKYSHPIFAPQNLRAWDGFRDCVPVVWEAPPAVRTSLPVHLSHYRLWRSDYFDIGYSVLADSVVFNSYCDNSVTPGHLYFYKVQAVYRSPDFNSAFSNIDGGASLASNWLYSNYTMQRPPVVDGDLNEPLWFEATRVRLFGDFSVKLANSGSTLFVGLMNSTLSLEPGWAFRFFFDDDNSDTWDADSSTEGYYEIQFNPGAPTVVYFYPLEAGGPEPRVVAEGAVAEWLSYGGSGFNAELVIDMRLISEFFALPSDTVGVGFQMVNAFGDTILNWPSSANTADPAQLGHLVLGSPGGLPALLISPPIMLVDLETGWSTNRPIRLNNLGDGTIIWELSESASWLEITPDHGIVPPGTMLEIDARFVSGIMPIGVYNTTINFSSNDPVQPTFDLPVELRVTPRVPRHYLSVYPPARTNVEPGGVVEVPIYIGELYGNEISQLDFTVLTNREFLIPLEVRRGAGLPAGWSLIVRNIYNDRVLVRLLGPTPLPSTGELIKIRYAVQSDLLPGRSSRIQIDDLLFNFGFDALPIPVPGNGVVIVGENLRYFWYGMIRYFVDDVQQDSVRFGLLDAATNDYDFGVDVLNTPPHGELLDAWFLSDDWKYLGTDIRPTGRAVEWHLWVERDGIIMWDPRQMWPGVMINGVIDMSVESTFVASTEAPLVITYDGTPGNFIWNINLKRGWNLISPPITASSMSVSSLFPAAMGDAWAWNPLTSNYEAVTSIQVGHGYWVLSGIDTSYTRSGNVVYTYTRDLPTGWLLLGSPAHRTYLSDQVISPSNAFVPGTFYYWDNTAEIHTYASTSYFTPGLGQWVYCRFPASFRAACIYLPKEIPAEGAEVFIEGELYLADERGQRVKIVLGEVSEQFPMPPPAPGTHSRIFIDGEMPLLESNLSGKEAVWTGRIELSKAQALVWNLRGQGFAEIEIDGAKIDMNSVASIQLGIGPHVFKVTFSRALPATIALHGNMPNPFNSTTSIAFDLPEKMKVGLEIFDLNGRRISRLVDDEVEAGTHRYIWNGRDDSGRDAPSGVYFIVLKAGGDSLQRKMLLIK